MRSAPASLFVIIVIIVQYLGGCSSANTDQGSSNAPASNSSNASRPVAKDNIQEFAELVQLPFEPDEVAWKERDDRGITAVIRFSPENAEKMSGELARVGEGTADTVAVESWFPAELIAQSDLTGESVVKGRSFQAVPFLKPPYAAGKITQIDGTDYFILQISS